MKDSLRVYLPVAILVIGGFLLAYRFVDPAPPRSITIATGSPDGAYTAYGQRYQERLAVHGVTVTLRHSQGSAENITLLDDPDSGVDVAFVQGGVGIPDASPSLRSLASTFHEPLWILMRNPEPEPKGLDILKGRTLAIGARGSGTRVLAETLLEASGVGPNESRWIEVGGNEALERLQRGEVDAAFFVIARPNTAMRSAMESPEIGLLDFRHAEAMTRHFPYLSTIRLPEGGLDLARPLPPRDLTLVSPTATLVIREGLHPALQDLLLGAAQRIHGDATLTTPAETFPSSRYVDFPLSEDAIRYFQSGPTFLRRVLPFTVAIQAERLMIMLIPLITLMIPLMRLAPPFYQWTVRRRIFRWYRALRKIEDNWATDPHPAARARLLKEVDRIQERAGEVHVPLAYAEDLYHLRQHIAFVRQRIGQTAQPVTEPEPQGAPHGEPA